MKDFRHFIHHFFIPQEHNNYRAKALHISSLTTYLVIVLMLTFIMKSSLKTSQNILGYATDITVNKLLDLSNKERSKINLSTLTYNSKLSEAAKKKALDMFKRNYWSHYAPDGTTPWSFIINEGYQYEYAGENLAKNFMFTQGVIDAWMNSPTHKDNLLRKDYTEVGFATVDGILNGEETTLVVQMFGKPFSATAQKDDKSQTEKNLANLQITPTILPYKVSQNNILSQITQNPPSKNTSSILYYLNIVFAVLLLIALFLDLYYVAKEGNVRTGGKNLAHFIFISFILLGLLLITKGAIL